MFWNTKIIHTIVTAITMYPEASAVVLNRAKNIDIKRIRDVMLRRSLVGINTHPHNLNHTQVH